MNWSLAWNGVVQVFSGIVTGISAIFDGVIEGVRASINSLISSINGISFTTPDWVPGIGGKSFGPLNIPLLYRAQIIGAVVLLWYMTVEPRLSTYLVDHK